MKKVKRGYFLDYHIPWVIKLPRNYIQDPDKDDLHDLIYHLFPFRSSPRSQSPRSLSKKSNVKIRKSTDPRWLLKPTKTFLPMSNEVVNTLNSRNKQLMIAHIQASDDMAFLHQLYH